MIETFVQPNGFVAATHRAPGAGGAPRDPARRRGLPDRAAAARGGGRASGSAVPAGTPHRFWNAGDEVAHFVCEVRPALQFESLLETMFALAAEGKTNRKGMPNLLRLAVIANAHFDTVRLPFPASDAPADRACDGRAGRPARRVPARLHPGGARRLTGDGLSTVRLRLLLVALVLAALVLAALGVLFDVGRRTRARYAVLRTTGEPLARG